jgi:hypothetical protein
LEVHLEAEGLRAIQSQLRAQPFETPAHQVFVWELGHGSTRPAIGTYRFKRGDDPAGGGTFTIGSAYPWTYPSDGEAPREVEVDPFRIDRYAVSNARFAKLVEATGYTTDAERYG